MDAINVILYSTDCPKCKVLKKKLAEKKIEYSECSDVDVMLNKGIDEVPVLEVDGRLLSFTEAVNWIKEFEV